MTPDDLAQLRAELEHDRDDLASTLADLEGGDEALVEMLQAGLSDLRSALAKLEGGQYGRCETCGGPISDPRLRQLPAVRSCLECEAEASEDA